jgi:hypothetical protein
MVMKEKDWSYKLVIAGVILFLCGILLNILTFIFSVLIQISFISPIIIIIGVAFAVIGGLKNEKEKNQLGSAENTE